jgi:hypothetical protein
MGDPCPCFLWQPEKVRSFGTNVWCPSSADDFGGFSAPLACDHLPVERLILVNAMIPCSGETAGEWWDDVGPSRGPSRGRPRPSAGAGRGSPAPAGSVEQGGDRARADGAAALADREGLAGVERDRLPERDRDLHGFAWRG